MDSIQILGTAILSDNWYVLRKITYEIRRQNGSTDIRSREAYDRGNGATILLYNKESKTVILTRQFRIPTFINGNESGMLIECCAGLLDVENPEECIKRETEEETGYRIKAVRSEHVDIAVKVLRVYVNKEVALRAVKRVKVCRKPGVADIAGVDRAVDLVRGNRRRKILSGRLRQY